MHSPLPPPQIRQAGFDTPDTYVIRSLVSVGIVVIRLVVPRLVWVTVGVWRLLSVSWGQRNPGIYWYVGVLLCHADVGRARKRWQHT